MIIAVDYDGTLYVSGSVNDALIRQLKAEQRRGNVVILWTCRSGQSLRDALVDLSAHGFHPNYVNANTPETVRRLGCDPRKIFADIYLDDKSFSCWRR